MSHYTLFSQLNKIFSNPIPLQELILKLKTNNYSKNFMDDNNDEPLLTILGAIDDYFTGRKPNIKVIENLDLNKYLGKWYEIARYDSFFEPKEIISSEALYEKKDGIITVTNTGFYKDGRKETIRGTVKSTYSESNIGKLDVSFFPPFVGNYWIIILADDYSYSVVTSPNKNLLWILAREKQLSVESKQLILNKLTELEYDISKLNWRND